MTAPVTASREDAARSTASAAPAGTRATSAARITSEPSRRISSLSRPTALSSLSPRNELLQTSSASRSVLWTAVGRTGRISWSVTRHAALGRLPRRLAARQAAADDVDHARVYRCVASQVGALVAVRATPWRAWLAVFRAPATSRRPRVRAPRRAFFDGAHRHAAFEQSDRLAPSSAHPARALRQRGVGRAVGDVRAVAAVEDLAPPRRSPDAAPSARSSVGARRAAGARLLRLREQLLGALERRPCRRRRSASSERNSVAVLHVRAEAAEVGDDRLAVVGVPSSRGSDSSRSASSSVIVSSVCSRPSDARRGFSVAAASPASRRAARRRRSGRACT